jgi:hypothetical protein
VPPPPKVQPKKKVVVLSSMDEQTAERYVNSFKSDYVEPNMKSKRYEFTINSRKFLVNTTDSGSFSMLFGDGTIRYVNPYNYTYVDSKNLNQTEYSIASLRHGNRVNLDYLYDNLTYIAMFRDYNVINRLKRYGSAELNAIIDYIVNNTYKQQVKITRPSKNVTNVLLSEGPEFSRLYSTKVGKPLDLYDSKLIDVSEFDNRGNPRKDIPVIKSLIRNRKYNCSSEKDTKQFLEDLSFLPTARGCNYETIGGTN